MKNIYLLPTDKPSRIVSFERKTNVRGIDISKTVYKLLADTYSSQSMIEFNNTLYHIYITSDEEIKEGDWCLSKLNEVVRFGKKFTASLYKKIILTTDQYLISDGVQAIDDEFLEWFVKNPSCAFVKVKRIFLGNSFVHIGKTPSKKERLHGCYNNGKQIVGKWEELFTYKIIITQEEPNRTHYLHELPNIDKKILAKMWEDAVPKLEPKRETLEEAAEKYVEDFDLSFYDTVQEIPVKEFGKKDFKEGAKWQQERSYSGEDMFDCWKASHTGGLDDKSLRAHFNHWFKKFKKK